MNKEQQQAIALAKARRRRADAGGAQQPQAMPEQAPKPTPYKPANAFADMYGNVDNIPDFITGRKRVTDESRGLPEVASLNPDLQTGLKIAGAVLTIPDDAERAQALQAMIPGLQISQDEQGTYILQFPDGKKAALNQPGISRADVYNLASQVATYAGPARLASMGKGLFAKMGIGGALAGAVSAGQEKLQEAQGGSFDGMDVATSAALGAGGEAVAAGIGRAAKGVRGRLERAVGAQSENVAETIGNIRQADEATDALGMRRLAQPQRTLNPRDMQDLEIAGSSTGGSTTVRNAFKDQNEDIVQAVNREIVVKAAPAEALDRGATRLKAAATKIIDDLDQARTAAATKFYQEAYKANPAVDAEPIRGLVKNLESRFSNTKLQARQYVDRIKDSFKGEPTLQQLHDARKQIDGWVDFDSDGKLLPEAAGALKAIRAKINDQIAAVSPEFRKGDAAYAAMSEPVKRAKASLIGKIAGRADINDQAAVADLFKSPQYSMKALKDAKAAIEKADPGAWADIYRIELEDRMLKLPPGRLDASEGVESNLVDNLPSKLLSKLIGNGKQFERLVELAPTEEVAKNLRFLKTVLERAQMARDINSKTAFRSQRIEELKGGFVAAIVDFFTSPGATSRKIGREARFQQNIRALAKTLTDPAWEPDLASIRKLEATNPTEAGKRYAAILAAALKAGAQTANDSGQSSKPIPGANRPNINLK